MKYKALEYIVRRYPADMFAQFKNRTDTTKPENGYFYQTVKIFNHFAESDTADGVLRKIADCMEARASGNPEWTVYHDSESVYFRSPQPPFVCEVYTFGEPDTIDWTQFENNACRHSRDDL